MKLKPIALMLCASAASAYEVETHGLMTLESFNVSILGRTNPASEDVYRRLGFDRVAETAPFHQAISPNCADDGMIPTNESYIDADPSWLASTRARLHFGCIEFNRKVVANTEELSASCDEAIREYPP